MSKTTHIVVAALAALLIMGSMRSFGNPIRGIGDDAILGLFSLAVVAVFVFLGWLAVSSLRGGSSSGGGGGGGGVSSASFDALKTAVDTGFTSMQTRIDAVKIDTGETRKAVDDVKIAVGRMEGMLKKWAPYLDDLNTTINALLDPIGKGVEEIKKATKALNDWKDTTWKKFSDDITATVGTVLGKVTTVEKDLGALTGAVGKLDTDQQKIKIVVDDIKKEQTALQTSVNDGFAAVPANVRTEVQKGLDAMQTVLGGKIDAVAASQTAMQGMLSGFVTSFSAWQGALATTLGGLSGSVAAAVKADVKAEVDNIRTDMTRELSAIASKQTSVQDALVRLTEAQDKMRDKVHDALVKLPTDLRQVMEAQLQRVEGVFAKNIQELKTEQQTLGQTVSGLSTAARNMQQVVLARLDAQRQSIRDQLNNNLLQVAATIEHELEPIAAEMFTINGRLGEVLTQVNLQFESLGHLRSEEAERFVETQKRINAVQSLLEKIDREGAKAAALEEVDNNVALIVDWCGQHGPQIQKLAVQLPALGPLLDEVRKLIDELEKRQKRARDRAQDVVKRHDQMGVVAGRGARFDSILYNARAATFFVSLEMLRLHMDKPVAQVSDGQKQKALQDAVPILEAERQALCVGEDSSLEQRRRALQRFEKRKAINPLYPKLELEGVLLTALCDESNGRLYKLFEQLQARAQETPLNLRQIKTIITKMKEDGAFEKVVQFSTEARQTEVKQRLGI